MLWILSLLVLLKPLVGGSGTYLNSGLIALNQTRPKSKIMKTEICLNPNGHDPEKVQRILLNALAFKSNVAININCIVLQAYSANWCERAPIDVWNVLICVWWPQIWPNLSTFLFDSVPIYCIQITHLLSVWTFNQITSQVRKISDCNTAFRI